MLLSSSRNVARPAAARSAVAASRSGKQSLTNKRGGIIGQQQRRVRSSSSLQPLSPCCSYKARPFSTSSNSSATTSTTTPTTTVTEEVKATTIPVTANTSEDVAFFNDDGSTTTNFDDMLAIASMRARQISESATQNRKPPTATRARKETATKSSSKDPTMIRVPDPAVEKEAINASDALLALTSSPTFVRAVASSRDNREPHDDLSTLHSAFLSVTTWCCSVSITATATASSSNNTNILILHQKLMELTERATQLKLPFHVPLYSRIAEALSSPQTSENEDETPNLANKLINLYETMKQSLELSEPVNSQFFSTPLVNLVKSNRIRDAIDVIKGITATAEDGDEENTAVLYLDSNTTMQMLTILEERASQDMKYGTSVLNESDAMELALLLQEILVHQQKNNNSESAVSNYEDGLEVLTDGAGERDDTAEMAKLLEMIISAATAQPSAEENDVDGDTDDFDDDYYDAPENIADEDIIAALDNDLKGQGSIHDIGSDGPVSSSMYPTSSEDETSALSLTSSPKDNTSSSSSPTINVVSGKDFEEFDFMLNYIYTRNNASSTTTNPVSPLSQQFTLPDVTSQIVNLNGGKEIRFTGEYEQFLLQEIMEENDDDDFMD